MAKKEQAIQQPVEIDASKGIASLKELQGLVNELNKSLRITANVLKDLGGSHSVALASALSPSRDTRGTNAAVKGFVSGTEALTDLQRAQNQGMNISAKAALAQTQSTAAARQALNEDILARYGTLNQSAVAKAKAENISTVAKSRADAIHKTGAAKLHEQGLRDTAKGLKDIDYTEELVDREEKRQAKHTEGFKNRVNFQTEAQRLRRKEKAEEKEEAERKKAAERAEKEAKAKVDRGDRAAAALAQKAKFADIGVKAAADKEVAKQGTESAKLANKLALQGGTTKELIELRASLRGTGRGGKGGRSPDDYSPAEYAAGSRMVGMLPGGGMLNRLGQMVPSLGRAAGAIGAWGSQPAGQAIFGPAIDAVAGAGMEGGMLGAIGAGAGAAAGAVGLGLAAGVGGAVALGEYGIGKTRDAYGARRGRLIGMEGVARAGSAMGGGQNLGSAFESIGGMGGMSEYGMDSAQALSARGAFLAARGSSETFRGSRSMNAVMGRYQVDPGIAGSGASLGYSGDQMLSMSERLHNAGAVPGASMQGLFAHEQRAAGYGILGSGVADKNTSFVNTLSRQGFGGGQFGAISAVQKLQGVGGGMADSIRGSMSQIGEALVLAKSVKNAGNLLGGIEGVDTMSAQEKFQAMQGSASVPALFGQRWSVAQASGRAGRATPDVDSPNFSGPRGEADAAHQSAMDQKAQVSKALLTLEKLDRTMEMLNTTMVENIEFNKKYMGAKTYAAASLNNGFQ